MSLKYLSPAIAIELIAVEIDDINGGGEIRRIIRMNGVRGRVVRKCYMHDGMWRLGSQVRTRVMARQASRSRLHPCAENV